MPDLNYLALPINADEGFPQSFRLAIGDSLYTFLLYVNIAEEEMLASPDDAIFDLPTPGQRAFMVMRVARETPTGSRAVFQRKLVPGLEYAGPTQPLGASPADQPAPAGAVAPASASELAFYFSRIRVARANINGVGAFGSLVEGVVAAR